MIRFTADEEFNARLEECAYQLYQLAKYFREPDWEYYVKERGVRQRTLDLLDYVENGFLEDEAADISSKIHRLEDLGGRR